MFFKHFIFNMYETIHNSKLNQYFLSFMNKLDAAEVLLIRKSFQ